MSSVLKLEDLFCKFLDSSRSIEGATTDSREEQDSEVLVSVEDVEAKKKEKKKKKKKKTALDSGPENPANCSHITMNIDNENDSPKNDVNGKDKGKKKSKSRKPETGDVPVNAESKSKDKKKKKDRTKSEESLKEEHEENTGDLKVSKKRKRPANEERASHSENPAETKDSKHEGLKAAEEKKIGTPLNSDASLPDTEDFTVSKKQKTENNNHQMNGLVEHKEKPSSFGSPRETKENGGKGNNGDASSQTLRKGQRSSEPANAFRRVKLEEVEFVDERLQNNSYWAKGGADSGYGAKAQEILGQVRGRRPICFVILECVGATSPCSSSDSVRWHPTVGLASSVVP